MGRVCRPCRPVAGGVTAVGPAPAVTLSLNGAELTPGGLTDAAVGAGSHRLRVTATGPALIAAVEVTRAEF